MNTHSLLEQLSHPFPEIFDHADYFKKNDLLNLSGTSKFFFNLLLKNAICKEAHRIMNFQEILSSHNIKNYPLSELTYFIPCKSIFEVQVAKIKKFVEFSLFLNRMDNFDKIRLRNTSTINFPSIFVRIIELLKTENEVCNEFKANFKDDYLCNKIINSLLAIGQFNKASSLLKSKQISFDISTIENNHLIYCLIHAPFLNCYERKILLIDLFQRSIFSNFKFKSIKTAVDNLKARLTSDTTLAGTSVVVYAIDSYLKQAVNEFLEAGDFAKANILEAILAGGPLQSIMEMDLDQAVTERELEKNQIKIIINKIREDLSKNKAQIAIDRVRHITDERKRNQLFTDIANNEIFCHRLNTAMNATDSISSDIHERDSLYCRIAMKQKIDIALRTLKKIKDMEKYMEIFFMNLPEMIDMPDIPKALNAISGLPNSNIRQKALHRIVEVHFKRYFGDMRVLKWIDKANCLNHDAKRLLCLSHFFHGMQQEDFEGFLNNEKVFYSSLFELLKKRDMEKVLDLICTLENNWERYLALDRLANVLFSDKDLSNWLNKANDFDDSLSRRDFLDDFFIIIKVADTENCPNTVVTRLLKAANNDVLRVLSIVNAYPIESERLKFLEKICQHIDKRSESEIFQLLIILNKIEDPFDRYHMIYDSLDK